MQNSNKTTLTFIADTHHYSETLGTSGEAYERRSGTDQKCLRETGAIIDAALEEIKGINPDALMIIGDISGDAVADDVGLAAAAKGDGDAPGGLALDECAGQGLVERSGEHHARVAI